MKAPSHPMQPAVLVNEKTADGSTSPVIRFKKNAIVQYLLDNGGIDMNRLAMLPFSDEDREQFAQLIGYSLSGFLDLPYVSEKTAALVDAVLRS